MNYSYSNVIFFDSKLDNYLDKTSTHNKFEGTGKLVPHFRLDISQVSWRTSCMKKDKLFFKNGPHANFDAVFFEKLYNRGLFYLQIKYPYFRKFKHKKSKNPYLLNESVDFRIQITY